MGFKYWIRLFLNYIWDKRKAIFLLFLYQIIFCVVCVLNRLENLDKLLYGVYISLFITLIYGIWDFVKYSDRIYRTEEVSHNLENIPAILPPADDLKEQKYQEIIKFLSDQNQQLSTRNDLKEAEMKDYYSLWAHQIKTPISAMRLMLQNDDMLKSYSLQEELYKIEQYIEMVLHYLRLDSMSSDLLLKEYQLKDIVNQAVRRNAVLFINSKLSLKVKDFSYKVITDEKWLLFVIEQLITNAVKYTPTGQIAISLEICKGKAWLVIEDTGIGIKPEDLPRIFERGFTGNNGRFDKRSTGIGLYLCKQILDKLSYRIEVFSEVGKGTKACVDVTMRTY